MINFDNQNEINNDFFNICESFRQQTNLDNSYFEYISAILYIIYYKNSYAKELYNMRKNYYIADNIDSWLEEIKEEISNKYLFENIIFKKLVIDRELGEENAITKTIEKIHNLIKKLENEHLESKKYIAKAYQYVMRQVFYKGGIVRNNGEIYTPTGIAKIMIALAVEQQHNNIADEYCGSGNILVNLRDNKNIKIFGREENIDVYNLCMTNLMLNEMDNSKIELDNFKNKNLLNQKYDCILTNPPFFSKKIRRDITFEDNLFYKEKNWSSGDYTYIFSALKSLSDGGKMAVILPHGALFRGTEKKEREELINNNNIDAIIGLPENLFYGTRISVVLMILKKNKKSKDVLFIDASENFSKEKNINIIDKENQSKIIDIYSNRKQVKEHSYIASLEEIKENNFDLTIKKYVKKNIVKENVEKKSIVNKLELLDKEKNILEENIKDVLEELNVKDVFTKYTKKEEIYDLDYEQIGRNIKKARLEKKYSIYDVAIKLQVSDTFIRRIETGMVKLTVERLVQICNLLGVPVDQVLKN